MAEGREAVSAWAHATHAETAQPRLEETEPQSFSLQTQGPGQQRYGCQHQAGQSWSSLGQEAVGQLLQQPFYNRWLPAVLQPWWLPAMGAEGGRCTVGAERGRWREGAGPLAEACSTQPQPQRHDSSSGGSRGSGVMETDSDTSGDSDIGVGGRGRGRGTEGAVRGRGRGTAVAAGRGLAAGAQGLGALPGIATNPPSRLEGKQASSLSVGSSDSGKGVTQGQGEGVKSETGWEAFEDNVGAAQGVRGVGVGVGKPAPSAALLRRSQAAESEDSDGALERVSSSVSGAVLASKAEGPKAVHPLDRSDSDSGSAPSSCIGAGMAGPRGGGLVSGAETPSMTGVALPSAALPQLPHAPLPSHPKFVPLFANPPPPTTTVAPLSLTSTSTSATISAVPHGGHWRRPGSHPPALRIGAAAVSKPSTTFKTAALPALHVLGGATQTAQTAALPALCTLRETVAETVIPRSEVLRVLRHLLLPEPGFTYPAYLLATHAVSAYWLIYQFLSALFRVDMLRNCIIDPTMCAQTQILTYLNLAQPLLSRLQQAEVGAWTVHGAVMGPYRVAVGAQDSGGKTRGRRKGCFGHLGKIACSR